MAKKSNHKSVTTDATRTANLEAYVSAFTALQWAMNDACEKCSNSVGASLFALMIDDLECTVDAIKANDAELHLEAIERDWVRLASDYERCGLVKEGPGIVMLLRFVLDQIKAVA